MSKSYRCDRCGAEMQRPSNENYAVYRFSEGIDPRDKDVMWTHVFSDACMDLCPECIESLERWIKEAVEMKKDIKTVTINTAFCPVCGSKTNATFYVYRSRFCVECPSCGMRSPFLESLNKAADMWNSICERIEGRVCHD